VAIAPDQRKWVHVLEGESVEDAGRVVGAEFNDKVPLRAVVQGVDSAFRFGDELLSKHVLFLGSIGSGKTNAMQALFSSLRESANPSDVFVVFDTKGDFLEHFYQDGDAVITNDRTPAEGRATWNIFSDLHGTGSERVDEAFEIASTVFGDSLAQASNNYFFAAGARDIFAAVLESLARREGTSVSNRELRQSLEGSAEEILALIEPHPDLAGVRAYLKGESVARSTLAYLQQTVRECFSGVFGEQGDFSVRGAVRDKGARAVFIEYDIARGAVLLPIYRVMLDLAIKEGLGRSRTPGNVFFLMDEFALLPEMKHISDGINFGRSLGMKFIVGSQNVSQVYHAYGEDIGISILSGFGTVFAFRLMDGRSRTFVADRFGRNRKRLTIEHAVRGEGVHESVLEGNVIEDWDLSSLDVGQTIASTPVGPPFFFTFQEWRA
jgi:Type IV secretion-system coupling protein DNA-binding domain